MKNSSYYIAPVGDQTHDLPHTVASNMVKVSHSHTHSATTQHLLGILVDVKLVDVKHLFVAHEEDRFDIRDNSLKHNVTSTDSARSGEA